MHSEKIIASISSERFSPYLKHCNNNLPEALALYQKNIEVSQAFYASLSVLEITLRNKIDLACKNHFATENWLTEKLPPELNKQTLDIKNKLAQNGKEQSNSRILAELNFGFWTILFNRKYARIFWKPLHNIFPNLPKENKKRTEVSSRLNHIRTFRNRIYRYEPIVWNINLVDQKRQEIFELINWLDSSMASWMLTFDGYDKLNTTKI